MRVCVKRVPSEGDRGSVFKRGLRREDDSGRSLLPIHPPRDGDDDPCRGGHGNVSEKSNAIGRYITDSSIFNWFV